MKTDSNQLSNGDVELAVSPATGRIVHYSVAGGTNVLWQNPRPRQARSPFEDWLNWGGDKVWVWPEDDWERWSRLGEHTPPGDPPKAKYEVVKTGRRLRMVSPVIASYGIRIVREISLEPTGTRVTLVNRLEKVATGRQQLPVAPWVVTQIPAPPVLFARLAGDAQAPGYKTFPPNPWRDVRVDGRIIELRRPSSPWVKMGLDADLLAVPVGDLLFTATMVPPESGACESFCRAQLFSNPDRSSFRPRGVGPYVEMEFTAPMRTLEVGDVASLTLVWELHHVKIEDAMAYLKRQ